LQSDLRGVNFSFWRDSRAREAGHLGKLGSMLSAWKAWQTKDTTKGVDVSKSESVGAVFNFEDFDVHCIVL
jgi:hypothetical protein